MVASSSVSGLWRIDKFQGLTIPKFWVIVNVANVHMVDVPLMHPHEPSCNVRCGGNLYLGELEIYQSFCKNNVCQYIHDNV
jgi:hypothetical protein